MRAALFFSLSLLLLSCVKPEPPTNPPAPVEAEKTPQDPTTPPATPASVTPAKESYLACGCGCCGGLEDVERPISCLYHAKGDSLDKIKQDDAKAAKAEMCKFAGCSAGTKYEFCD